MHTASPFFNSNTEEDALVRPAVEGTLAILEGCLAAGIKDIIITSSTATVFAKSVAEDHVFTEDDFSDEDMLRKNKVFYPLSKVLAEKAALDFGRAHPDIRVVLVRGRQ